MTDIEIGLTIHKEHVSKEHYLSDRAEIKCRIERLLDKYLENSCEYVSVEFSL